SRTLWVLKNQVWGENGHKERRKIEQQRRIEMRTKRYAHPDLEPTPRFHAPEPPSDTIGGFRPVGHALPQQSPTWPAVPARPRPTLSPSDTAKDWKASGELRRLEEQWIRGGLTPPKKN